MRNAHLTKNTQTTDSLIILGIDPGSLKTGFGVIQVASGQYRYISSGIIKIDKKPIPERLGIIAEGVTSLVKTHQPDLFAIEDVFFARDPQAALKLGQARGAAIIAAVLQGLPVGEYAPKLVKQSVVGNGNASKDQVQYMVKKILGLDGELKEDAADGLAIAICHANHQLRK